MVKNQSLGLDFSSVYLGEQPHMSALGLHVNLV